MDINKIINEVLTEIQKPPMKLTENVKISKELEYHIENKISLSENIFRIYSTKFFDLINEVRSLYVNNKIRLNEDDIWMVESNLGEKIILESGEEIYLDAPMYEEDEDVIELRDTLKLGEDYHINILKKMGGMRYFDMEYNGVSKRFLMGKVFDILYSSNVKSTADFVVIGTPHFKRVLDSEFDYFIFLVKGKPYYFQNNPDKIDYNHKDPYNRDSFLFTDDNPITKNIGDKIFVEDVESLSEAKHRGRNVKLNSPFRTPGGPKKFAVYVKTPKGTIKKVTFGDPNLRVRNANKKAAKSFRARHKCDQKKDRTTAGYWSCNVSRFRKKLGLKSSSNW
jgi:hypothetical protein